MPGMSCFKYVKHKKFLPVDLVHKSHIYVAITILDKKAYKKMLLFFFFK